MCMALINIRKWGATNYVHILQKCENNCCKYAHDEHVKDSHACSRIRDTPLSRASKEESEAIFSWPDFSRELARALMRMHDDQ